MCFFATTACIAQTNPDDFYISKRIDSSSKKELRFVHFEHTIGIIFPVSYAKKTFGDGDTYFMPDTNLIKKIDKIVIDQFCDAITKLNEDNWKDIIERSSTKKEIEKYRQALKNEKVREAKWCPKLKDSLPYYGRQYIGYIFGKGERVIRINMIDLRNDSDLKNLVNVSWIQTPLDADYPHCETAWFYVDRNLLSINLIK